MRGGYIHPLVQAIERHARKRCRKHVLDAIARQTPMGIPAYQNMSRQINVQSWMHRAETLDDSRKRLAAKSAIGQLAIIVSRNAAPRRIDCSQNLQCGLVSEVNVRVSHKTQSFESPWSRGSCKREGKRGRRFPSGSFRKRKSACIGSFSKQYSTPIVRFLPKNTDLKRFSPFGRPC